MSGLLHRTAKQAARAFSGHNAAARIHSRATIAHSQPSGASGSTASPKPDIHQLAKMAQIAVTDQEAKDMEPKINSILNWFDQLQSIDMKDVPPSIHAGEQQTALRTDQQTMYPARSELLQQAPSLERGYFRVPKIATGADSATDSTAAGKSASPSPAPAASAPAASTSKPAASSSSGSAAGAPADLITSLDFRVGRIVSCERHPEADSLYVEKIDIGEAEPRTIVSGLVKYVPIEAMQDRMVVVIANLKPRNMRGIKSAGMVLAASDENKTQVVPILPPEGAAVGERLWFGDKKEQPAPAAPNAVEKKKLWESAAPGLRTDGSGAVAWQGAPMLSSAGAVTVPTLPNCRVA